MVNGTRVSFLSHNQGTYNGRKEYLVNHHYKGGSNCIGVAFYTGECWQLLHYRYNSLSELKAVIRHKYTGASLLDSKKGS